MSFTRTRVALKQHTPSTRKTEKMVVQELCDLPDPRNHQRGSLGCSVPELIRRLQAFANVVLEI